MEPKYKRVILKISGEALAGDKHVGLDEEMLDKVALEVKQIRDMGVQVAVVVGGGNFWRGAVAPLVATRTVYSPRRRSSKMRILAMVSSTTSTTGFLG